MKIRILKDVLIEVEKPRLEEVWDQELRRWNELNIESIQSNGSTADLITFEGDVYLEVPSDCFEILRS